MSKVFFEELDIPEPKHNLEISGGSHGEMTGRMLEAVEKARKVLSSTSDTPINIDYLLEEEDLNKMLKRDEFEGLIDSHLRRFTDLLKAVLTDSGLQTD